MKKSERAGIPLLKSKAELKEWFESLPINNSIDIRD